MRAGTLRHRLYLEEPGATQDEFGEQLETWVPVTTLWASRGDLSGREYFAAQQTQSEITTEFRTRWVDGITSKMRLVDQSGTVYLIESAQDEEGRGRELVLLATREG